MLLYCHHAPVNILSEAAKGPIYDSIFNIGSLISFLYCTENNTKAGEIRKDFITGSSQVFFGWTLNLKQKNQHFIDLLSDIFLF